MLQGALAVQSGQKLETVVKDLLLKYFNASQVIPQYKFTNVYNKNAKIDFHIQNHNIVIECKRQNGAGTADEKIPFVLANLAKIKANLSILVLDGSWYKEQVGIVNWAKEEALKLLPLQVKILFPEELDKVLNEFCQAERVTK